jgi:hypothetical protein
MYTAAGIYAEVGAGAEGYAAGLLRVFTACCSGHTRVCVSLRGARHVVIFVAVAIRILLLLARAACEGQKKLKIHHRR